ncbi:MAG: CoA transferase [Dehalococcoidia bacterium]|nr:MAG: CoA transferase [Dehalococcoidia bacterium]
MNRPLPLEGIRILDLGQFWAAPSAGRAWADAGADVIKVESQARPDPLRIQARGIYPDHQAGEDHWNRSGMVNERNRNKRSLTLDLTHPRGHEIFMRLVNVSDVVSQNYSRRVMPSLGLDYETLAAANPQIIMVSILSQGLEGPESDYVSYGQNLEQLGGISYFSGYPDDWNHTVGFALPDPLAGVTAAFSLLAALRHRERTGRGLHVDFSQREAASLVVGDALVEYSLTGASPRRLGNHEPGAFPSGCYPCAGEDRWITLSVRNDQDWGRLCRAMLRPALVDDPRFMTLIARKRHSDELDAVISEWTAQYEHHALLALLQDNGISAGALLNPRELFQDPHLRTRGFWERVEDPSAGTQEYYGRGYRLSLAPLGTRAPAPTLGQHNREILGELLGMGTDEFEELERGGVIGTRPLLSESGGMAGSRR